MAIMHNILDYLVISNTFSIMNLSANITIIFYWYILACIICLYYLFIGVEKSGRNAEGDSWWETWQEVLHQDEWRSLFSFLD